MIIPLSPTLKVSANAYTILRETREQTVVHGDLRGLHVAGIIPGDGSAESAPIELAPPTDNTPRISIPTVSMTINLPSQPELSQTTCTPSRGIDEPDVKARRSIGLHAFSPSNPYRIRRRQEAGSPIGETGDSITTAIDSGSTSSLLTASSTLDSLPPSSTSSSASSNSDSETSTVIFPIPVSSSSSSTSETANDDTSTVLPRATTDTSSASGISDSIFSSPIITLPLPSLTSTLPSASSTTWSLPSTLTSPTSVISQRTTSSTSSSDGASSTNSSVPTSSSESSLSSSAVPTSSNLSISDASSVFPSTPFPTTSVFSTSTFISLPLSTDSQLSTSGSSLITVGSSATTTQSTSVSDTASSSSTSAGSSSSIFATDTSSFISSVTSSDTLLSITPTGTAASITPGSTSSFVATETSLNSTAVSSSFPSIAGSSFSSASTPASPSISGVISSSTGFPSSFSTAATDSVSSTTTSFEQSASGSIIAASATQTSSFDASSPMAIYTSSTIANNGATSSAMETVTTTFVTTRSGTPATITTVMVGPSGSLNDAPAEKRKGLPTGAIAAISIISVLAVAAIGLWLFLARRRRRRSLTGAASGGTARFTPDRGSTMRSLGADLGLGPGAIYGLARARTDSAGVPIRTSPLDDEDAYPEAPHSASAHSGFTGGPNSLEGGLMRETNVASGPGSAFGVLPGWMADPIRADESGHEAERVRGGNHENETTEKGTEGLGGKDRERGLLLAAGLGSSASISATPPQPRSPSSSNKDPFVSPKRTSFVIDPYPKVRRDQSVSPQTVSPTYASLLPTRSAASDIGPRPSDEDRRASVRRSDSGPAYLRLSRPPSAWSPVEGPRDKGKEREKENRSATPSPVDEPNTETFGRKRSSLDLSSSSHGYGPLRVTSSQGHGSATASGENELGTSSGSGSSGSHQGSAMSHARKTSEDGGFFARAASLTRTNLRNRLRRTSASGISSHTEDAQSQRTTRPPSPVSRLVTSAPQASIPTLNVVIPPSPSSSLPSPRAASMLVRAQAPGPINLPPLARSAMTRAAGPGPGLPAIMATPPPLPTPDRAPDGLLDPRLTARLREIHAQQASFSTIGLRDDEDYSRPIYALVNNRDSMTSASSDYSQPSQSTTNVHTPTQPEMRV